MAGYPPIVSFTGVAFLIYFGMGFFGASLFGQDTQGNIMVNHIVQGKVPCVLLYGAMLIYLSLGMTTTQYALRATLDLVVSGPDAPFTWARQVTMTSVSVGTPHMDRHRYKRGSFNYS
jgi:hypothetical protein